MTKIKTGENTPDYIVDEHGERIDQAPPAQLLSERSRDVVRRYEEFLHSHWWAAELRKYPSFVLGLAVPKLASTELVNRFEQWLSVLPLQPETQVFVDIPGSPESIKYGEATGHIQSRVQNEPSRTQAAGSVRNPWGSSAESELIHKTLYDFIVGFVPPITFEATKGTWLGNRIRASKGEIRLSGCALSAVYMIELFCQWSADPAAQESYEKQCQEWLDTEMTKSVRIEHLTEPSRQINPLRKGGILWADRAVIDADGIMKEVLEKHSYKKASKKDTKIFLRMIVEKLEQELEGLGKGEDE